MRGTRALATLDDIDVGDHACWVVDGTRLLSTGSAPYVADGALFGDRFVLVGSVGSLAEVRRLRPLPASAVVIDPLESSGSVVAAIDQELKRARREGFRSVRVLVCRESKSDAPGGMAALLDSELGLDEIAALGGATVVCAYLPGSWDALELEQVMCVHPQTLGSRPELPTFHMFRSGSEGWKVTGVIDSDGAHAFGSVLRAAALHTSAIRLCFEDVELIDAAGMRALVNAALHLPDRSVTVEGANRIVRLTWQLSGYATPEIPVEVRG